MYQEAANIKRGGVQVQSVSRALAIINCFRESPEMGISEIAAAMNLNKSTVFGLVNTLASYGYLEQVASTKKYRLGITLFELGNTVLSRIDIRNEAKEICSPLAQKYRATVHIATHSDGQVVYIDKIDTGDSLVTASKVGRRAPMHCTGVGKAMLAFLPREYLDRFIFCSPLRRLTPNTITDKKIFLNELEEIRKTGIAMDREEIEPGLNCIASPVLQRDGLPEIAVSLSFPYGRIWDINQEEAKADLVECTRKLSERLGYRRE